MSLETNELSTIYTKAKEQPKKVAISPLVFFAKKLLSRHELTKKSPEEAYELAKENGLNVRGLREAGFLNRFGKEYNLSFPYLIEDALTYKPGRITFVYQNGSLDIDNGEITKTYNLKKRQKSLLKALYDNFGEEIPVQTLEQPLQKDAFQNREVVKQDILTLKSEIDEVAPGVLETTYETTPATAKLSGINFFWIDEDTKEIKSKARPLGLPTLEAVRLVLDRPKVDLSALAKVLGIKANGQTVEYLVANEVLTAIRRLNVLPVNEIGVIERRLTEKINRIVEKDFSGNREDFFADIRSKIKAEKVEPQEVEVVETTQPEVPTQEVVKVQPIRNFSDTEIVLVAAGLRVDGKPANLKNTAKAYQAKIGWLLKGEKGLQRREYKNQLREDLFKVISDPEKALDLAGEFDDPAISDIIFWLNAQDSIMQTYVELQSQKVTLVFPDSINRSERRRITKALDENGNFELINGEPPLEPRAIMVEFQEPIKQPQRLEDRDKNAQKRIERLIERFPVNPNSNRRFDSQQLGRVMGVHQKDLNDAIEDKKIVSSFIPTWGGHYECTVAEYTRLAYWIKFGKYRSMDKRFLDDTFDEAYARALAEYNIKRDQQNGTGK